MPISDAKTDGAGRPQALHVIQTQLAQAVAARKCHQCGCLHQTVEALAGTIVGREALAPVLAEARRVFRPKSYDCLGCAVCYPAIAANAFADAFPEVGETLELCPTATPEERVGWPPLPGDYRVVRYRAPVAVCTLNSGELMTALAHEAPNGLAIVGALHTENLGIEHLIRNVLANPYLRFLILCGVDTQQAVGHLPGQSLASLFSYGIDERGRICGAQGKRPVLKNVHPDQVKAFLQQVELIPCIGEEEPSHIADHIERCRTRDPGPAANTFSESGVMTVRAPEPKRLIPDPSGFFVVYPDAEHQLLMVEHYTTGGVLDAIIEGHTSAHAAYLGRELARAESSLKTGEVYVQDRAPGDIGAIDE
jgi:tetrahydromethanopterin S-methyltransferase subunit A